MTTSQPTNASEWQLYRVLQRANLLQYYDTFVAQGGDDVQQLCEAGEEEFLEIMALVGMASKPLHVRRLQKALQEWVANPAAFQGTGSVLSSAVREPPTHVYSLPTTSADLNTSSWSMQTTPQKSVSPVSMVASNSVIDFQANIQMKKQSSSPQPPPVLLESQINDIAKCAAKLAASLPYFEAKTLNMKKDINKQIFELLSITKDDPNKLELMRKYGAIYRRFDSTRQYEKSMSMHEICVNEASAQLCFHMPSLLTRREDLFPLARQVVKDSGYQYSKGHSRASDLCPANPSKRQKLELLAMDALNNVNNTDRPAREERLRVISTELSQISERQEQIVSELDSAREGPDAEKIETLQASLEQITNKHLQLLTEQSDLLRKQSYEMYVDVDIASDRGDDSNLEASGSSSPSQGDKLEPSPHTHTALKAMLATGQLSKSALGKPGPGGKNSLFDEGLRIAQQYGLGDFAMELKSLQGTDDEKPMEQLFMSRNLMLEQNGGDKITNNDNDPHGKLSPNSKDQNEDSNDSYYENGNGLKPEVIIKQEVMSQHSPVRQDVDSVNGV